MAALEWSGNFRIDMELDNQDNLRIIAGINNYASPYTLKPGEVFTTPAFLSVLSTRGKGEASRKLQQLGAQLQITGWERHPAYTAEQLGSYLF